MHDPRIGRFFAMDPLAPKYPHNSPYAFSENRVIDGVELEGLEVQTVVSLIGKDTEPIPNVLNATNIFNDLYSRMVDLNLVPILPQPSVKSNNSISSVAVYEGMGLIKVRQELNKKGSLASTYGDAMSILYHEYNHYLSDAKKSFPIQRMSDGGIVQWETDETATYSVPDSQIKRDEAQNWALVNEWYPDATDEQKQHKFDGLNAQNTKTITVQFKYAPSNLALDEINSYSIQLQGEQDGLYKLSDEFREEINERIARMKEIHQRRLKYEKENNLNPDGSKNK